LAARLDQMKAALPDFGQKTIPPDLAVDPILIAPNDRTLLDRLRGKDLLDPEVGADMVLDSVHGPTLQDHA
jgi:hypothetical protein